MYRSISACRLCGSADLEVVLELGHQYLTGVFPRDRDEPLTRGPLTLVRCEPCGLVQLLHSYDRSELYGERYGYRSSLNRMMVSHLEAKARRLAEQIQLASGDHVLDIGSNDGTLLSRFDAPGIVRVGFDPSAGRWRDQYPQDSHLIPDFFTANAWRTAMGSAKAKLITSIAMVYDLEQPLEFARDVASVLSDDGIWHLEQSYLPSMLSVNAYDTVCHEHLEYYALRQIAWIADRVGLTVLDAELNDVNGGSFAVTLGRSSARAPGRDRIRRLANREAAMKLDSREPFIEFSNRVIEHRDTLSATLRGLVGQKRLILGYGASTKGNVILQYAGIGPDLLPAIAEVNRDKFGCVTPGTWIPIISEAEAHARRPDYFLIMPWHFRQGIIEREVRYLAAGGKLIFPLPRIEVVEG